MLACIGRPCSARSAERRASAVVKFQSMVRCSERPSGRGSACHACLPHIRYVCLSGGYVHVAERRLCAVTASMTHHSPEVTLRLRVSRPHAARAVHILIWRPRAYRRAAAFATYACQTGVARAYLMTWCMLPSVGLAPSLQAVVLQHRAPRAAALTMARRSVRRCSTLGCTLSRVPSRVTGH